MSTHYTEAAASLDQTGETLAIRIANALRVGEGHVIISQNAGGLEVFPVVGTADAEFDTTLLVRTMLRDVIRRIPFSRSGPSGSQGPGSLLPNEHPGDAPGER